MAESRFEFEGGVKSDGDSNFSGNVAIAGSANVAGDLNVAGNLTYTAIAFSDVIPNNNSSNLGNSSFRWILSANTGNFSGNVTFGSVVVLAAGNTTSPSFRVGMGVAPTTPANGDFWANSTGFFTRSASVTQQLAFTTSSITGGANTANAWATPRTITLGGDLSGNVAIDGSANVTLSASIGSTISGKTFSGSISVQGDVGSQTATISNGVITVSRISGTTTNTQIDMLAGGVVDQRRWSLISASDGLLYLRALADNGAAVSNVFTVARTGVLTFIATPKVGTETIWHSGNDGTGSGLDADLFQGNPASFYSNATNLGSGTVPAARLAGSYGINISGTANNATNLNGQADTFYTNIPGRLGYTPLNKGGDSATGNIVFTVAANTIVGLGYSYIDGGSTYWRGDAAANSLALFDSAANTSLIRYNRTSNRLDVSQANVAFVLQREFNANVAIISGAATVDVSTSNFFTLALNSNLTGLTYTGLPAANTAQAWTLKVNIGGSFTITWPAAVKHAGGSAPALPTGAGNTATFIQYTVDGGTKIHTYYCGPTN